MRLWTVQPPAVIEILQKRGRYVCDPTDAHVFANGHSQLLRAYRWLSNVMVERVGPPPSDCVFPVWAWHTYDGRRQSDLRKSIYRSHHHGFRCIEIEIPESRVLLSDESLWHFPLNGWYLPTDPKNEGIWEREEKLWEALPEGQKDEALVRSWRQIFHLEDGCHDYIQATFWELNVTDIRSTRVIHWS